MSRFLPKSLFGRILSILLLGLVVSHAVGSLIYVMDREQAVRAVGGFAAAQRIANLTKLVQEVPRDWRERIVGGLSDQSFRVSLSTQPPPIGASTGDATVERAIQAYLADQLSLAPTRQPRVSASIMPGPPFAGPPLMARGPMMHAFAGLGSFRTLQVAIPLADGPWLYFTTSLPESGPELSSQFLISMGIMGIIIVAVSIWAVRSMTAPLASLSAAAERFGTDLNASPMPETGTIETQRAAHAFNTMQKRLRALVENRTRLLAAISHDLRTPLTLLRLRAENVDEAEERERMLATIADMESMVAATLQFARDEAQAEPRRRTDVTALLASVVDDMADAGRMVTMDPAQSLIIDCQPGALKRALTNLIDNAVNYGKQAHSMIRASKEGIVIAIDDAGPGIPTEELERVFQPFYRLESSRSRDTGGIGLGLAIAQSIVQTHGGQLTLANRAEGGLRASITLPI